MNIIEHVWDELDALVRARYHTTRRELWVALQEEWDNFLREALNKLFESMPRRITALLKARGEHTKY